MSPMLLDLKSLNLSNCPNLESLISILFSVPLGLTNLSVIVPKCHGHVWDSQQHSTCMYMYGEHGHAYWLKPTGFTNPTRANPIVSLLPPGLPSRSIAFCLDRFF